MPATLPLSSQVDAILGCGVDILKPSVAAELTGRSASTISAACASGDIEASYTCSRGRGTRKRWNFTRAALLSYLWKNTTGERTLMRSALAKAAPELLALLEPQTAPDAEPAPALPENVIPITQNSTGKRTRRDEPQAAYVGDLFAFGNAG